MNYVTIASFIDTLMRTQEYFEPDVREHASRTKDFALLLGVALRLGTDDLLHLSYGAMIHDYGKIAIPAALLSKAGKYTNAQRVTMELHPRYGYEMLRLSHIHDDILEIVLHHHERWDGTGYPDRLIGKSTPLLARISAIADVYDALTTDRPYRAAMSSKTAITVMRQDAKFDPDLLDTFTRLVEHQP